MRRLSIDHALAAWQQSFTDRVRAWRLRERLSYHRYALLAVMIATLIGQAATLIQRPLASVVTDTYSYVAAAQRISESPAGLIETFRTPGYPLFLALVFRLTGGVDYNQALMCDSLPTTSYCAQTFHVIVLAQTLLLVLTIFEGYVLAFRLSQSRLVAAITGVLLGINIYFASWERVALSELLSMWAIVTLFLCFERLVRAPSVRWATLFGLGMFAAIMIRPANLPLPLLLLPLLLIWWLRQGVLGAYWRHAVLAGALVGGLLLCYMTANLAINQFFGITFDHNVTLLGKVIEYDLEYQPTAPQYEQLQRDLQAYVATGAYDPWAFGRIHPAYGADNYQMAGEYASAMIKRYPLIFAQDSVRDTKAAWTNEIRFYAPYRLGYAPVQGKITRVLNTIGVKRISQYPYGNVSIAYEPLWVLGLLVVSELTLALYWLLPVLLIAMAVWVWRRKTDAKAFMIFCVLLTVASAILLAAVGNYEEFTRIRFPMDWGMVLGGVVALAGLTRVPRSAASYAKAWRLKSK